MKASDIPAKFPLPFGADAAAANIRVIPLTSADPDAASLTLGFPPNTFIPPGAGGEPPNGKDMNGILFESTSWNQWQQAGGPLKYDGTFSAAIGGYPAGAIVAGAALGLFWLNLVDDNTTDPDAGGANWRVFPQNTTSPFNLVNGAMVPTVAGNALTVAIKTLAGADPSASDPVFVVFRNVTAASGDAAVITLTSAVSVTISSGSTLGAANATAFRVWIAGFNDAGTFRLAAINCLSGQNIYKLGGFPIASSTAEGGAGGADSAQVFYSGSAVTSKAYCVLGYMTWESGLTTAGTWASGPTRSQLYGLGVLLPGQSIGPGYRFSTGTVATGTTQLPFDNTIPQSNEGDQYMSLGMTPDSAANLLAVSAQGFFASTENGIVTMALFRDAAANAVTAWASGIAVNTSGIEVSGNKRLLAASTLATTFKIRAGLQQVQTTTFNGIGGTQGLGGVLESFIEVDELMA